MITADPAGTTGSSSTQSVGAELSSDASRLAETARSKAAEQVEAGKGQATSAAKSVSSALERAAGDLEQDDNAPDWLSSAFRQTARRVDSFSSDLEGRSADDIGREVSRFARQNPTAFLAASAAAGFAAARFLRAGSRQHEANRYSQPGGSGMSGGTAGTSSAGYGSVAAGSGSAYGGASGAGSAYGGGGTGGAGSGSYGTSAGGGSSSSYPSASGTSAGGLPAGTLNPASGAGS